MLEPKGFMEKMDLEKRFERAEVLYKGGGCCLWWCLCVCIWIPGVRTSMMAERVETFG